MTFSDLMFGTDGYIYSTYIVSTSSMLMKQEYTKGAPQWNVALFGTYTGYAFADLKQDSTSPYYLFVLTYRSDSNGCYQ